MMRNFKSYWITAAALLVLAVACSGGDEPEQAALVQGTATPTPEPAVDLDALPLDVSGLSDIGLTDADIQCLAVELEAEIFAQLSADDISAADVLAVVPALQACGVDLVRLLEAADDLITETLGDDYPGLDSLPFTVEQIACLVLIIDAELLEDLVGGEVDQAAVLTALEAFSACGIGLADLLALSGSIGTGPDAVDEATNDDVPAPTPTLDLSGATDVPDFPDIPDILDTAGDLPFTEEQLACLTAEIDADTIASLVSGDVSPLAAISLLGVLTACDVNLADLLN